MKGKQERKNGRKKTRKEKIGKGYDRNYILKNAVSKL